jgi:hypothetical protein
LKILSCGAAIFVLQKKLMKESLTIRLDQRLAQALEEEARNTGQSKGQIARAALESRLQHTTKASVMGRYFGTIRGPRDLSTNKSYRRDWKTKRV